MSSEADQIRALITPEVEKLYKELDMHDPETEEYARVTQRIVTQTDLLKKLEPEPIPVEKPVEKKRLDPNTVVGAVSSIVGILIVISYEHLHPIAGKAIGFVTKPRI